MAGGEGLLDDIAILKTRKSQEREAQKGTIIADESVFLDT